MAWILIGVILGCILPKPTPTGEYTEPPKRRGGMLVGGIFGVLAMILCGVLIPTTETRTVVETQRCPIDVTKSIHWCIDKGEPNETQIARFTYWLEMKDGGWKQFYFFSNDTKMRQGEKVARVVEKVNVERHVAAGSNASSPFVWLWAVPFAERHGVVEEQEYIEYPADKKDWFTKPWIE